MGAVGATVIQLLFMALIYPKAFWWACTARRGALAPFGAVVGALERRNRPPARASGENGGSRPRCGAPGPPAGLANDGTG